MSGQISHRRKLRAVKSYAPGQIMRAINYRVKLQP